MLHTSYAPNWYQHHLPVLKTLVIKHHYQPHIEPLNFLGTIVMMSDKICNDICEVNDMLNNVSTTGNDNNVPICANCGKEGNDINNICNKCKMVKYCNAACKKKHRHKHKKDCDRRVAESHDIKLFKEPPPAEDCPICFIRIPILQTGSRYNTCCGKVICSGCVHAPVYDNQGNKVNEKTCPFCRIPQPKSTEEADTREKKRMEKDDPIAIYNIGNYHRDGRNGFPQDMDKALELWHRAAAELGYDVAYCNIGIAYEFGQGVEVDEEKARHYYELAAIGGNATARYNLGNKERKAGNIDRALKHYMIAVRGGYADSLKNIRQLYSDGYATKEDYMEALQLYQEYLVEIKSRQRNEAADAHEQYQYYK